MFIKIFIPPSQTLKCKRQLKSKKKKEIKIVVVLMMPPPPFALPLLKLVVTQHQEHLGQGVQNTGTVAGAQPEAWRTPVKASAPATRDKRDASTLRLAG